jgi:hypothetical protein
MTKAIDLLNALQELQKENKDIFDLLQIEIFIYNSETVNENAIITELSINKLCNTVYINSEKF